MGRSKEEMEGVTLLGNKDVKYSMDYAPEMLQTFDNKHPDNDYFVKFNCPEFTSLCPITGQPDFATIYIDYIPDVKMGDEVVVFGKQGDEVLPIEELANKLHTINYELTCVITKRVPRVYLEGGKIVGIVDHVLHRYK